MMRIWITFWAVTFKYTILLSQHRRCIMSRTLGSGTHGTWHPKCLYYPKGSYYQGLNLEYMTSCDIEVYHLVHIINEKNSLYASNSKMLLILKTNTLLGWKDNYVNKLLIIRTSIYKKNSNNTISKNRDKTITLIIRQRHLWLINVVKVCSFYFL